MNADSTDIHKYLGQVIVERRQKAGWSQRELSLHAGIHRTYVSDIERGTRNITVSVLERVANALQVRLAVLFRDAEAARRRAVKDREQVSSSDLHKAGYMHIMYLPLSAILSFSCCCWTSEVIAANQQLPQQQQQTSKPPISTPRRDKNPRMLLIQGWHANRNGDYALGRRLATRAIAIDSHEIDAHLILAQALQGTYEEQTEKDETLLLQCMREWLIVYRAQGGDEEGLTARGVGAFTDLYADEERGLNAKKQMVKLTGMAPRLWETDAAYINRIARRSQRNVSGKVVKSLQQTPAVRDDK